MPSLLAAGLVGVLALASAVGGPLLAGGLGVVSLIFALGAVRPAPVPGAGRAAWLALTAGVVASAWVALEARPVLTPLAQVLGVAFVLAVLLQLLRRDGRPQLTASLTLSASACALAVLPAGWVALREADGGPYAVGLGLLGVGVVCLAEASAVPVVVRRMLAILVAGAAAGGVVLAVDLAGDVPAVSAVAIAVFAALVAVATLAAVDRVVDDEAPADHLAVVVTPLRISMPLIVAAPVVYVLGRMLVG